MSFFDDIEEVLEVPRSASRGAIRSRAGRDRNALNRNRHALRVADPAIEDELSPGSAHGRRRILGWAGPRSPDCAPGGRIATSPGWTVRSLPAARRTNDTTDLREERRGRQASLASAAPRRSARQDSSTG